MKLLKTYFNLTQTTKGWCLLISLTVRLGSSTRGHVSATTHQYFVWVGTSYYTATVGKQDIVLVTFTEPPGAV